MLGKVTRWAGCVCRGRWTGNLVIVLRTALFQLWHAFPTEAVLNKSGLVWVHMPCRGCLHHYPNNALLLHAGSPTDAVLTLPQELQKHLEGDLLVHALEAERESFVRTPQPL